MTANGGSGRDRRTSSATILVMAAAVGLGLITTLSIVATTSRFPGPAAQLAWAGFVVLAASVALGWSAGVGLAGLPMLAAAVIEIATVSSQGWLRATAVGCLWFCTAELAWDSIERRDGQRRAARLNRRRVQEVATVVAATLAVTLTAVFLIGRAPDRTFWIQILTLGVAVAAMIASGRHLEATGVDGETRSSRR
ncbi:MAG: hypothetical protein OER95_05025 [Acidimicrobiia bacterium]|nr:hypothetical protein [Acidimicrobiia bacterium]